MAFGEVIGRRVMEGFSSNFGEAGRMFVGGEAV